MKHIASGQNLLEDAVMGRIIDLGGLDFLIKGAESIGQQRCNRKLVVLAAARALALYLDPDNAEMFEGRAVEKPNVPPCPHGKIMISFISSTTE